MTRRNLKGVTSIGMLLGSVFVIGVLIAAGTVYSAYVSYRAGVIQQMAHADAGEVSDLIFEHLYSVMRKGWTRDEIDDVIHHIQIRLKHHEVIVVRAEPVVKQYGDRDGHAVLRENDALIASAIRTGQPQSGFEGSMIRHAYPVLMASECQRCHEATPGEVNGVIAVNLPYANFEEPISNVVYPMLKLALLLILGLLFGTYLILLSRVVQPMKDLTDHVSEVSEDENYARDLVVGSRWPRELQALAANFNHLMERVRISTDALRESSLRDPLTGLFNRRFFDNALEQAGKDAASGSLPFAVLLIDLDGFKPVNDLFGHSAGDTVLINVARSMQLALRESDIAARIGGDEFAVLAMTTTADEALVLADRLREMIEKPELRFGRETLHPRCSIGVATYPANGSLGADILHAADLAMYTDKARRNARR